MRCAIWYYLYNLKNVKNTHRGVLSLVKLQAEACNFTKIDTSSCVFFTFFKLCKWCQITQRITNFDFFFDKSQVSPRFLKNKWHCILLMLLEKHNIKHSRLNLYVLRCFNLEENILTKAKITESQMLALH